MTLESALASIWVNTYAYTPPSNDLEGTIFGPPCINLAECGDFRVTFERISDFVTTVSRNRTRQMSISQWVLALKNLIHQCIHPTTHLDEYALGQVERTLMNVGDAQVSEEPLSLVVVTQLIKRPTPTSFGWNGSASLARGCRINLGSDAAFASESRHFDGA